MRNNEQARKHLCQAEAHEAVVKMAMAHAKQSREEAAKLVEVPSPGAIVRDEDGKLFRVTEHGWLDTLGNEGVIPPGEEEPQVLVWLEYEILQQGDTASAGLKEAEDLGFKQPSFICSATWSCTNKVVADGGWCPVCSKRLEAEENRDLVTVKPRDTADAETAGLMTKFANWQLRSAAERGLEEKAVGQEVELEDHVAQGFNQYGKASVAILEGNGFLWNGPGLDWRRNGWSVYLSQEGGWVERLGVCITYGKHWGTLADAIAATKAPGV